MGKGEIGMDNNSIYESLLACVRQSGALIKNLIAKDNIFEEKSEANFLSYIDLEIQDFLIKSLIKILPNSSILSEETDSIIGIKNEYIWVIDPVDGTTNLIHKYPHFSTSVALLKNRTPILAAVFNPMTNELFSAQNGKGAYLNEKRIIVSTNKVLKNSIVGFGFPYDRSKLGNIVELVRRTIKNVQDLRRTGSSALDLAYLACGRIDCFFEFDLELWDYAAGGLLINEAGGTISNWNNEELDFINKSDIIASNKLIHDELMNLIHDK